jgi:hypothetical protein
LYISAQIFRAVSSQASAAISSSRTAGVFQSSPRAYGHSAFGQDQDAPVVRNPVAGKHLINLGDRLGGCGVARGVAVGDAADARRGEPFVSSFRPYPMATEVSSGDIRRHRLSRAGDRQLSSELCPACHGHTPDQKSDPGTGLLPAETSHRQIHKKAMRCIKLRVADVVYRTMISDNETSLVPTR